MRPSTSKKHRHAHRFAAGLAVPFRPVWCPCHGLAWVLNLSLCRESHIEAKCVWGGAGPARIATLLPPKIFACRFFLEYRRLQPLPRPLLPRISVSYHHGCWRRNYFADHRSADPGLWRHRHCLRHCQPHVRLVRYCAGFLVPRLSSPLHLQLGLIPLPPCARAHMLFWFLSATLPHVQPLRKCVFPVY